MVSGVAARSITVGAVVDLLLEAHRFFPCVRFTTDAPSLFGTRSRVVLFQHSHSLAGRRYASAHFNTYVFNFSTSTSPQVEHVLRMSPGAQRKRTSSPAKSDRNDTQLGRRLLHQRGDYRRRGLGEELFGLFLFDLCCLIVHSLDEFGYAKFLRI
jgi:hypothetical protein